jgi:hypothetical protein
MRCAQMLRRSGFADTCSVCNFRGLRSGMLMTAMLRVFTLLLVFVLLAAPNLSLAFNAHSLQVAKSCCDGMNGSCGNAGDPQTCCGNSVVRLESNATPSSNVRSIQTDVVLQVLSEEAVSQPLSLASVCSTIYGSPPISASPPLVLRI